MSTRCRVGIVDDSGVTSIYVHQDGNVDGVGKRLLRDFSDEIELMALLDKGDCVGILTEVEPYGDDKSIAAHDHDLVGFRKRAEKENCEFVYLYDTNRGDPMWLTGADRNGYKTHPLEMDFPPR